MPFLITFEIEPWLAQRHADARAAAEAIATAIEEGAARPDSPGSGELMSWLIRSIRIAEIADDSGNAP